MMILFEFFDFCDLVYSLFTASVFVVGIANYKSERIDLLHVQISYRGFGETVEA